MTPGRQLGNPTSSSDSPPQEGAPFAFPIWYVTLTLVVEAQALRWSSQVILCQHVVDFIDDTNHFRQLQDLIQNPYAIFLCNGKTYPDNVTFHKSLCRRGIHHMRSRMQMILGRSGRAMRIDTDTTVEDSGGCFRTICCIDTTTSPMRPTSPRQDLIDATTCGGKEVPLPTDASATVPTVDIVYVIVGVKSGGLDDVILSSSSSHISMWLRWLNLRVSPRSISVDTHPYSQFEKSSLLKLPCIHKYVFVGCKAREATNPSF